VVGYGIGFVGDGMNFPRNNVLGPITLLLVLGFLGLAALAPLPDKLTDSPVGRRSLDAAHLPLFALASGGVLWFVRSLRSEGALLRAVGKRKQGVAACLVAALFVGIAALVEIIQPVTGRSASLTDFLYGAIGAIIGAWWVARRNSWSIPEKGGFLTFCLVSLLLVSWPIEMARQYSLKLGNAFPRLLVGEASVDREFWQPVGGAQLEFLNRLSGASETEAVRLRVRTEPGGSSGVNFRPTDSAADWSGWSELVLRISGEGGAPLPFKLGLKIEDTRSSNHSTRFNSSIEIGENTQTVRVPLADISSGLADLTRITRMAFFVSDEERTRSFIIEGAFLE